jgi:hypothetical protein
VTIWIIANILGALGYLTFEGKLRRSIHTHTGPGIYASCAAHIDDGAAALLPHEREDSADESEWAEEIGIHLLATFFIPNN